MITSTGTGTNAAKITINGTGGNGEATNHGVSIGGAGTQVTSAKGDITLIGQGGSNGTGASNSNMGIRIYSGGAISSTGTGANAANISIVGQGSNGALASHGFNMENANTNVSTVDGSITITGTGGTTAGGNSNGLHLVTDPDILSTGTGTISLTGIAGTGGVDFHTGGGVIDIGGGAAKGDITLSMQDYSFANTAVRTTGNIILKPRDATSSIGISGGAGTLQVTDALVGIMTPGNTLIIGDSLTGSGAVDLDEWNMSALGYATAVYGGPINVHNNIGNQNITGTYQGTTGSLNAGTGTITATTGFSALDIIGSGATLSAGYIGLPSEPPNQNIANRITISGVGYPFLTANPAYTYAGYIIGLTSSTGGGGGGGGVPEPAPIPVTPVTPPSSTPPVTGGGNSGGSDSPISTVVPPTGGGASTTPTALMLAGLPSTYTHPATALISFLSVDDASGAPGLESDTENVDVRYQQNKERGENGLTRRRLYTIDPQLRAWLSAH